MTKPNQLTEAIDFNDIQELGTVIDNVNAVFSGYAQKLPSIQAGLAKAQDGFSKYLDKQSGWSKVMNAIATAVGVTDANARARAKIVNDSVVFLATMHQAMQVLPMLVTRFSPDAAKNPGKPINASQTDWNPGFKSLQSKFSNAFTPAKALGGKLPYGLSPEKLASEIMVLSLNDLNVLSKRAVEAIQMPISQEEAQELKTLFQKAQAMKTTDGDEAQPATQQAPARQAPTTAPTTATPGAQDATTQTASAQAAVDQTKKTVKPRVDREKLRQVIRSGVPAISKKISADQEEQLLNILQKALKSYIVVEGLSLSEHTMVKKALQEHEILDEVMSVSNKLGITLNETISLIVLDVKKNSR